MRLVIFGASGKVGRLAVAEALARGHSVTAYIHRTNPLKPHPNLTVVRGDIHDKQATGQALAGRQAVICTLGSWGTKEKDILSSAMRAIIPAMHYYGIDRIVTLTGTDARDEADKPDLLNRASHLAFRLVAPKIAADSEEHLRLLHASGLDWTSLRSPVMTNGGSIFYKLSLRPGRPWHTITRKAVAKALLDQLDGAAYSQAAPYLFKY